MTSPGSGDDRSPAAPRAVMDDLLELQERAVMLQTLLEGSPTPLIAAGRGLTEGMMSSLTSALSALNTSGGGAGDGAASSYAGGRGSGGPHRRQSNSCRRRTLSPFLETVTTNTLDDGHAWRKYGQKRIQDSENPRSYYRCTHMPDQGCKARKQVQVSETNPSEYIVSYFGQHTCRDPSTVPLVIEAATAPPDCANFICFGSATTSAHVVPHRQQAVDTTMVLSRLAGYSSSLPAKERCGSEEAISGISSSSRAGLLLGNVVGSAPEYRWPSELEGAGGIGTGSFPSSPSSLGGFMAGSTFGSFGNGMDDDLFGFDP